MGVLVGTEEPVVDCTVRGIVGGASVQAFSRADSLTYLTGKQWPPSSWNPSDRG